MLRTVHRTFASVLFSLAISAPAVARAACGDGVLDDSEECDDGGTSSGNWCSAECTMPCTEVGAAATDHTCQHGEFGPFAAVTAQAYPGTVLANVNPVHTYFTVELPGTPGANRAAVRYRPNATGPYAFYLKENYPIVVRSSDGEAVPVLFEHPVTTCNAADSLTWVVVVESLDVAGTYYVDIGPLASSSVSFAIEFLPEFTSWLFPDGDGDGLGAGSDPTALTWCAFPESLSVFGEDCDDADPASYPATNTEPAGAEICDGRDNDCDGEVDNVAGAPCTGTGGVTGTGGSAPSGTGGSRPSNTGGSEPTGMGGVSEGGTAGSVAEGGSDASAPTEGGAAGEPDPAGSAGAAETFGGTGGTTEPVGEEGGAGGADSGGEAGASLTEPGETDGGSPSGSAGRTGVGGSPTGGRGGRPGIPDSSDAPASGDGGCTFQPAGSDSSRALLTFASLLAVMILRRKARAAK
jgi:cysteine-rich repeat protein